jgi:hypothetical protein
MPQRKSLPAQQRRRHVHRCAPPPAASGRDLTGTQSRGVDRHRQRRILDLFVGNENGPAQLFRNKRNGTFENIAAQAGVARRGFNKGVAAGRLRQRRLARPVRVELGGTNFLYRNNRNGRSPSSGRGAGVPGPGQGFPTWFFDYDNDGSQDCSSDRSSRRSTKWRAPICTLPRNGNTLKLYRNLGDGSFQDTTRDSWLWTRC